MFCTTCGKKDEMNGNFCGYCGTKMSNISRGASPVRVSPSQTPPSRRKKPFVLFVSAALVLLAAAFMLIGSYNANPRRNSTDSDYTINDTDSGDNRREAADTTQSSADSNERNNASESRSRLVKTYHFNSGGSVTGWEDHEYDAYGNRRTTRYDGSGSVIGWSEMLFNNEKMYEFAAYDAEGTLLQRQENEFDGMDQWIRMRRTSSNPDVYIEDFEYDGDGILIARTIYEESMPSRVLKIWYRYENDSNGQQISRTGYQDDGSIESRFDYDSDGNTICQYFYDNGRMMRYVVSEHNTHGQLTKQTTYDDSDSIISWSELEYSTGSVLLESISPITTLLLA